MATGAAIVTALAAVYAASEAKKAGDYNKAVAQRDAEQKRMDSAETARRQERINRKRLGSLRAQGISADVLEESAMEAEMDELTILSGGDIGASRLMEQGEIAQQQGRQQAAAYAGQAASSALLATGRAQRTETT